MINSRQLFIILICLILVFTGLISCSINTDIEYYGIYGLNIDDFTKEKAINEGIEYESLGKGEKNKLRNKWEEFLINKYNPYMVFRINKDNKLLGKKSDKLYIGEYYKGENGHITFNINKEEISINIKNDKFNVNYGDLNLLYNKVNRYFGDPHTKGIKYDFRFKLFSTQHILVLLATALTILIAILIFKQIGETGRTAFRITWASILIIQDMLFMLLKITQGTFDIGFHLPFQISRFAIYMCFFMLLTKNYKLFEITYFFVIGSIHAIITPNLSYSFPHLEYFFFFISHGGCFVAIYYMVFIEKYEPTIKSFWKSVVLALALMVVMIPINFITNGNYLYIMNQPSEDTGATTTLDIFGPWPIYIIFIILIGFVTLFLLGLLPFLIKNAIQKKKNKDSSNTNS